MKKLLSNRWVHILLFLSILGNVFMGGYILARDKYERPKLSKTEMPGLAAVVRFMPREQRRELFHRFKDQRDEYRANKRQLAVINRDIIDLMKQPQVDRQQVQQLLDQERELKFRMFTALQNNLVEALIDLPPEERQELLEEIRRRFDEKRAGKPGWGHRPPQGHMSPSDDMPPPPDDMPPPRGE